MIVCICNRFSESQIRAAAGGEQCAETVYARLGGKPQCGQCLCYAEEVLAHCSVAAATPIQGYAQQMPHSCMLAPQKQ